MSQRSWRISPRTRLGRWTIGLAAAMPILFWLGSSLAASRYEYAPAGSTVLADLVARPALALAMLAGMAAGVSAFIAGLIAILKQRENAVLVYLSTLLGGLLSLFLVGEVAFPH